MSSYIISEKKKKKEQSLNQNVLNLFTDFDKY